MSSTLDPTDSQAPPARVTGTVAVVDLGLLGASLGLRLRRRNDVRVLGWARRRESVDDALRRGMIDVGSTKQEIVRSCRNCLGPLGVHFVGRRPMPGSEQSGLDHCTADLYGGAVVFVANVPGDDTAAVQTVRELWQGLGCLPLMIDPEEHDRLTSRTSHVLHLLAAAATHACLSNEEEAVLGGPVHSEI